MLPLQPQFIKKDIRSYVIRSGRITLAQEKALSEQWDTYGLNLDKGLIVDEPAFKNPDTALILEIGFGMGDGLLEMAQCHPDQNFIGIEVHPPGVGRLVSEASKQNLHNLRIFCADATDVLQQCIADNSIDRIQLFFPDPWHKKRHHKRRIVNLAFIDVVATKLKPGGVFHMATDWLPYAEYAMDILEGNTALQNCAGLRTYSTKPSYRPETKFEKRGLKLGHSIQDLLFLKRC